MNRREFLIILIAFSLGVTIMYFYNQSQVVANKAITIRVIDNCIQGLTISQKLISSCSDAYAEATTCMANLSICNIEESTKKLQVLNKEKEKADGELKEINLDMQTIIDDVLKSR